MKMKKARMVVFAILLLFVVGCQFYVEGVPSFTGPILNRDLTEKPSVTLSWLAGRKVAVVPGRNQFCSSSVVGHTLENWLGRRGAQPVVREEMADYEAVFFSDHNYSGNYGRVESVKVRLRIVDRLGNVKATSKGESSYWEYRSYADEDQLCEDATRRAVKNLFD